MTPTAVPSRITIDFRDAAMPSRTWILGVDEAASDRIELIAFEGRSPAADPSTPSRPQSSPTAAPRVLPTAVFADCACPEFCERDHANE